VVRPVTSRTRFVEEDEVDIRREHRLGLTLASVLVLIATACGGATPSAAPSLAGSPGPTTAASASPAAELNGTVSIAFVGDIQYWDPALAYDTVSWAASRLLFDQLIHYDAGTGLIPGLAAEMPTISDDGLVYTFKLRDGVMFHDTTGAETGEMTADDVVFSINRLLRQDLKPNPSPVGGAFFGIIAGADKVLAGEAETASGLRAVDPSTLEIELAKPDKRLLNILAMGFGSVIPKDSPMDATEFAKNPIGTGPYHLSEYTQGQRASFALNDSYWGDRPMNGGVEMRVNVDDQTQLQQAIAGQLDLMGDPVPPGSFTATVNDPTLEGRIHRRIDVAIFYLAMDTSAPGSPLSEVKVRQAFNHAVDKDNLVRIANGRGGPAHCILPPAMPGHDPACKPYTLDLTKASSLMAEAGQAGGFSTKLYTDTTDLSKAWAESIQADLAKINVQVELVLQDWDVLLGTITTPHEAPMVLIGWFQDFPDPSDFVDPILSCATAVPGGANSSWYCNEEVDALAAAALGEPDDAKRIAMYQDIQNRIMADAPWVPTTFSETVEVVSARVAGTYLHPVYPFDLRPISVGE
jgi:ABC-type transport system substrate-binding protein